MSKIVKSKQKMRMPEASNGGNNLVPVNDRKSSGGEIVNSSVENVKNKLNILLEDNDEYREKNNFIQELSNTLNELQDSVSQKRDRATLLDSEKPVVINGVRITPGKMLFKDAYDGKSFNKTLTITNVGIHSVTVRLFPPTSNAFKIKPAKTGHTLSSGLSLVRKVKFLYTKPTAIPQALMDIYINNTCFRYEFLVATCYTKISVTPKIIDFGEIDVGLVSAGKYITITNSGTKRASYSIDVGRNPLEIIIQPMKGTIQPGESKKITVEVFGVAEGEFKQEFWIKIDPLQRIHIQGHFIQPNLMVEYPLTDPNFFILSFPKTFVGVRQQRNIVIKNHSSTNAMFCVTGRTEDEKFPIRIGGQKDINYKQFYINPPEGRLHANQHYIMGVTFAPQKPKNRPDYYLCLVIVDVKRCRVGNISKPPEHHSDVLHSSPPLLEAISVISLDENAESEEEVFHRNHMISILLYGEVEIPNITMEPKRICLNNLKVNEFHLEPLKILNNSKILPLTIKYNKVACIEVEPKSIFLPPNHEVGATIKLRPSQMGDTNVDLIFDVFYGENQDVQNIGTVTLNVFYNSEYVKIGKLLKKRKPAHFVLGITPFITNEVGYQVDDVRFNSKIEMPRQAIVDKKILSLDKNNDALIAFPNDRARIMRPWRKTIPCNTLFAKLPRVATEYDEDYDLNPEEKKLRETTQTYYKNYIRSLMAKKPLEEVPKDFEDYVTTNEKLIMMQNVKINSECRTMLDSFNNPLLFVALTPYELHKVIVTPNFIQLGRLAANTDCSNNFNVENKNGFPIHISIKALYDSISIHQNQFILPTNSHKNINFIYHSDCSGSHHIPMFVILNFFHIFDITVLAKIVSNTVKCKTNNILIKASEKTAFLELTNPINSDVKFTIDTTFFQLESFPNCGVIPANRNMTCAITVNPEVGYTPAKEIAVISESGAKELVQVHFERKRAAMIFNTDILDFGDVPLNTTVSKELIIKNNSDQLASINIEVEDSDLFPEITINPLRDLLWQKGNIAIKFSVKFKQMVKFTLPVKIIFQNEFSQYVTVKGQVIYPDVNLSPNLLKIPKIPPGSVVKAPFKVTNLSVVPNFLSFPLEEFPEFSIMSRTGENVTNGVTLDPKEKIDLYLEFRPQEVVAYCIYLPYILNGIIGPPELNRPDSLKSSQYLPAIKSKYKTLIDVSSKLVAIKILCAAGKKWLHFSCLTMKFHSFDHMHQEFAVINMSDDIQEITFKMKNIESFLCIPSEGNIDIVDDMFKVILAPEESFKMMIEFRPVDYGIVTTDIPIYVKDYSETQAFNHINLSGNNPEPQILISKKLCSFLPTCVGSKLKKNITLELLSHTCNGYLDIDCGDPHIAVWYLEQQRISDRKLLVLYSILFAPGIDCVVETKIKFSCPCNASAEMEIYACGDSSLVLNFMGSSEIVDECTYPFFPELDDKSDYASVMHSIVPVVEMWLYTQGYMYQNYYKIPDDIARYPVEFENTKHNTGRKKAHLQLPLVQLLINLMGKSILKYIDNGLTHSEDLNGRTLYNYVTYRNTISFLKSQGILVPGLRPEQLLPYAEYLHFRNNLVDNERPATGDTFSEDLFYRFSKQKWLDLFFRIFKVLVYQRIVDPELSREDGAKQGTPSQINFVVSDKEQFDNYVSKNLKQFPTLFFCDAKLLLWLQYHYNNQKTILWPNEDFGDHRLFDNFSNLDDSVALATVTAAYCPYVVDQLKDVYADPKKLEHKIHNACKVVQVWKSLKFSFDIHPQTIVMGSQIKTLFIVTYLYDVLPNYYPTEEVKIGAPLSDAASYELNVSNCGEEVIKYVGIFFGEGSELFQLDNNQVVIPGKSSRKIRLTYFAKKVLEAKSILVLSGEASGQKYARSMAVSIIGTPNTSECQEIKVAVETYETKKERIALQSPYEKSYSAKIFMCFEEPKSYRDFHAISAIKTNNIPREVNVIQNNCKFSEKGEATIVLDMCFVCQGLKRFYLYFCNKDIGDFCVLINIMSITKRQTATEFVVQLPDNFQTTCTCRQGINILCPKVFVVDIPCRNPQLWQRTASVVERSYVDNVSARLLKRSVGTPRLFRMLKFYLERFPQGFMLPSIIFEDHAEFQISPNKRFSTQSSILKIRDVTSEDTVPLIIHWNDSTLPNEDYIELKNTNEKETRFLKLLFPNPVRSDTEIEDSKITINSSRVKSDRIDRLAT